MLKLTTGIKKRSEDFKKRMFVSQFQTLTLKKIKLMVSSCIQVEYKLETINLIFFQSESLELRISI